MSDPHSPNEAISPWLSVEIDHRFGRNSSGFHLQAAFKLRAERAVIFGPSGSGKSSLLRAITGLLEPDAGEIQLKGANLWRRMPGNTGHGIPVERRRVGLMMQNPALFPHLSVARNVAFALRGMKSSAREQNVSRLLQIVGAEALANQWPAELSGGQLQRVAIARTLAAGPSVLLLDEPFAALDGKSRQQLSVDLHRWAREHNVPVLTVTHNLEEAFSSGEEVLVIKEGRIVAQGMPREVLAAERERLLRSMGVSPLPGRQET